MIADPRRFLTLLALALAALPTVASANAVIDGVKKTAQAQIRTIVEPIFTRYCAEECKLLSIDVTVDNGQNDTVAPGFDDVEAASKSELEPSSAEIKLLVDEKIGPNTRTRVLELVGRYLETLDYPVRVSARVARFPSPAESAAKIAELRERVTKRFRGAIDELISKYCPKDCLLIDYDLQTELANIEEAQYGNSGEYFESGGVAIRIRSVGGTLLMDEAIPEGDRANLLEMARLKVSDFRNVALSAKAMKLPRVGGEQSEFSSVATYVGADGKTYSKGGMLNKESRDSKETSERTTSERNESNRTESQSQKTDASSTSTSSRDERSNSNVSNTTQDHRTENFSRFEKIERVENGDALAGELKSMRSYAVVFAGVILALLAFIAFSTLRSRTTIETKGMPVAIPPLPNAPRPTAGENASRTIAHGHGDDHAPANGAAGSVLRRFESENLRNELMGIFAEQPRVAKYVFGRILTEEGIETTSAYLSIFGESVVLDLLRDPSLQHDLNELMEYYAHTPIDLDESERHELLKKLHHRTVAGKMAVIAARTSAQFDFLAEMDGMQIWELVRNESFTVKAIVLTQCDNQKRSAIFAATDEGTKMRLLSELSRIDYLPRDYIQNVAMALKRKRQENPRLNTEALPGSEVLVNLLERSEATVQQTVMRSLESSSPDSARLVKHKLVSLDTLSFLPDGQLLEVILSLRHEELLQFLKGCRDDVRHSIFSKCPRDLVSDLEEELTSLQNPSRDIYGAVERKVLNRVKMMAQDNLVNLADVNDRMFATQGSRAVPASEAGTGTVATPQGANVIPARRSA